jgi:hypothetical protein
MWIHLNMSNKLLPLGLVQRIIIVVVVLSLHSAQPTV